MRQDKLFDFIIFPTDRFGYSPIYLLDYDSEEDLIDALEAAVDEEVLVKFTTMLSVEFVDERVLEPEDILRVLELRKHLLKIDTRKKLTKLNYKLMGEFIHEPVYEFNDDFIHLVSEYVQTLDENLVTVSLKDKQIDVFVLSTLGLYDGDINFQSRVSSMLIEAIWEKTDWEKVSEVLIDEAFIKEYLESDLYTLTLIFDEEEFPEEYPIDELSDHRLLYKAVFDKEAFENERLYEELSSVYKKLEESTHLVRSVFGVNPLEKNFLRLFGIHDDYHLSLDEKTEILDNYLNDLDLLYEVADFGSYANSYNFENDIENHITDTGLVEALNTVVEEQSRKDLGDIDDSLHKVFHLYHAGYDLSPVEVERYHYGNTRELHIVVVVRGEPED